MKQRLIFLSTLLTIVFGSCKKFIEVDLPIDKVTADKVFDNDETATAAVVGIYSQMMPTIPFYSSGGTTIYAGLSADELFVTNATAAEDIEFQQNNITPANSVINFNFWTRAYRILYHTNACIENIKASAGITQAAKERLLGEALFVRALHYSYLVNLFGDVPLVLSTDYDANKNLPRTPAQQVWAQIITDLTEAKNLLPPQYESGKHIRPNKWTAVALLARAHLYNGNWQEAEAAATEVITSGTYLLEADLNKVFTDVSKEAIWQLIPVETGFNTTEARYFVPTAAASNRPAFALTPQMVAAFENNDARKSAWIGSKTVASQLYHYPFKYKIRNLNLPVTEYYTVLRLAEQYLIRAEARAQQNKIPQAQSDLNAVRNRAGLPATTAIGKDALLAAIEQERRVELFAEWGHRWFDLKRTGRINIVLPLVKTNWQTHVALFPVPQAELVYNPFLTQNPGY